MPKPCRTCPRCLDFRRENRLICFNCEAALSERLPMQPLLDICGNRSNREMARLLHISGTTFRECRDKGIPVELADRLANRLDRHPSELWPEEWWTVSSALVDYLDSLSKADAV